MINLVITARCTFSVCFLTAGVVAIYGIGAFWGEGFAAGLADHILAFLQPLFPFTPPKAQITAPLAAIFLSRNLGVEDFSASSTDDPANRPNEVFRASIEQLIPVIFLQLFLILLFPKAVIPHDLSPSLRPAARISAFFPPLFVHPAS